MRLRERAAACEGRSVESLAPDAVPRVTPNRARLRASSFFLTYSQTRLTKEQVMEFLLSMGRVKRAIACGEHHQDGGNHVHALVEFDCRKDMSNKHFDMQGEHPNVLVPPGGDSKAWLHNHWTYCFKEDANPLTYGDPPETIRKRKRDDVAREALALAREQGVPQAMLFMEQHAAMEVVKNYDQIYRSFTQVRNIAVRPMAPPRPLSAFRHVPIIVEGWHALYINGPTGCGKTALARALLPEAPVIRHRDQLKDCDFSKGVIFDDFEVGHWPPTAVIHLLDWEEPSGIDVKHAHVVVPPGTRKIFTHNGAFDRWVPTSASEEQVAAMRRRVNVVNVHRPLFEK